MTHHADNNTEATITKYEQNFQPSGVNQIPLGQKSRLLGVNDEVRHEDAMSKTRDGVEIDFRPALAPSEFGNAPTSPSPAREQQQQPVDLSPWKTPPSLNRPPSLGQGQEADVMAPATPSDRTDTITNGNGPHPSFIQVAKPYIFEQKLQDCMTAIGVTEAKEDNARLQGVLWIDGVRKALQL